MKARHEFESDAAYRDYLRTYFAVMGMQGILASGYTSEYSSIQEFTRAIIEHADELLKQLEDDNP